MKERQNNYDLLRIISMFLVIILHLNAHYMNVDGTNEITADIESFINVLTRVSVPCFVMLSGAFVLNKEKNKNFKTFYAHVLCKIVLPFIIVSAVLLLFSFAKAIISHGDIFAPLKALVIGDYYNLWYMFMLIGLYIFVPVIILVKERISNRAFNIIAFVWLAFAVLFQSFSTYLISYSFGIVFAYMGYFLVGNVLYNQIKKDRNGWIYIIVSIILLCTATLLRQVLNISIYAASPYVSFFSPLVTISSILFFIGFSKMRISISFGKLPIYTFYIYLFHTAVYEMILMIIKDIIFVNPLINIFVVSFGTFIVSLLLSVVFSKLQKTVYKITNLETKVNRILS